MKISELAIKNVRALPDLDRRLGGAGGAFDVVLVTGPMGSGKTRLLETIAVWKEAIGPYGAPPRLASLEKRQGAGASLSGAWELSEDEVRRGDLPGKVVRARVELPDGTLTDVPDGLGRVLSAYTRTDRSGKFEYFPASRRLSTAPLPVPLDVLSDKLEAGNRFGKEPGKYGVERAWLIDRLSADLTAAGAALSGRGVLLAGQAPDSLAAVRATIARLAPHLRLAGLSGTGPKATARFVRADRTEVTLDELSDGEQQAVLFALAFHRLALTRSVVLIDTPELFIHPSDHVRFFDALRALGADNQIIAATCSQGILSSVRPEQIIDLGAPEHRA